MAIIADPLLGTPAALLAAAALWLAPMLWLWRVTRRLGRARPYIGTT